MWFQMCKFQTKLRDWCLQYSSKHHLWMPEHLTDGKSTLVLQVMAWRRQANTWMGLDQNLQCYKVSLGHNGLNTYLKINFKPLWHLSGQAFRASYGGQFLLAAVPRSWHAHVSISHRSRLDLSAGVHPNPNCLQSSFEHVVGIYTHAFVKPQQGARKGRIAHTYWTSYFQLLCAYCQTSSISRTKSHNLNVSHVVLQLSLPNQ